MTRLGMRARRARVDHARCGPAAPTRRILRVSLGAIVAVAVGPVTAVQAAQPSVVITSPTNASVTSNQTPTISGTREALLEGLESTVIVNIYQGALSAVDPAVTPVRTLKVTVVGSVWSVTPTPAEALAPGSYTVLAEEEDQFRQFVRRHLPRLGDARIRLTRLCLYCDTFDGDFWID